MALAHRRVLPAIAFVTLAVAFGSFLVGAAQNPTPVTRDPQAQPQRLQPPRDPGGAERQVVVGKGTITGTIVVAGAGQPARRARVNLSSSMDSGGSRSTTTDEFGRFAFTALPEGRYSLTASKPGLLNATYGQRRPGRPGTPIQLADGQRLQVQLQMVRGGVITGTVLDEHGEAVPGTPVRALRYVMQSGQRTLQSAGNAQTDDRGVYRIYGLQPSDYIVFATPRNTNQTVEFARQAEVQAVLQAAQGAREAITAEIAQRVNELRGSIAPAEDATTGYAPVYYPGTTTPASAVSIAVGPGEEKSGIDFQHQVVAIARIEGIVTTSASQGLPQNVQITLVNTGFPVPGIGPGGTRADAQGTFRIANVPPGQYTLVARATIGGPGREGGPAGRAMLPAGRGETPLARGRGNIAAEQTRLWANADVTVDGRNISNVGLLLQPGIAVSGRIVFDGASVQPPADLTRLRVNLTPITPPGGGELAMNAAGRVEADGRFTIGSVIPGKYRLTSSGAGNGWFLGSSAVEGQDTLDFPVDIQSGKNITSAVITFTDRQSELTGTIVNDRAEPVPDYSLILYPADHRYWTPQSRRIQSSRPATDGRFSFRNLPAGEYRLAPVFDPEPGSWYDPAFLEQLDSASIRVSIADGEKKEQNIRVAGGV